MTLKMRKEANLEASDASDEDDIVELPRPREDFEEWARPIEGPMTEEQVNVEELPTKVDCANSSSVNAPMLLAHPGFLSFVSYS